LRWGCCLDGRVCEQGFDAGCAKKGVMQEAIPETNESPLDQSLEVARIATFSDGVFAIAITLLALQLQVPGSGDLGDNLQALLPNVLSFLISFAVIGSFWVTHHRLFARIVRYNAGLIWLNMLVLLFIVLMPFTASLIGEHGDQPLAVVIYALSIAAAGLASTGMAAYAFVGHRLCSDDVPPDFVRFSIARGLVVPGVFLASLLLLPLGSDYTMYGWLVTPVVQRVVQWRLGSRGEA